jgi:hypothetical protein
MSSDKTARDRLNNQRFKDIYVHASQEPWIPFFQGSISRCFGLPKKPGIGPFF